MTVYLILYHFPVPDRPADIKALAASSSTVLLTWKPPVHPNGIITKYTVFTRDAANPTEVIHYK